MAFSAKKLMNQTKLGVSIGFGVAALFLNTIKSEAQTIQKSADPNAKTKSVVSEEDKKLAQEKKAILASIKNYIGAEEYHRLGEAGFRNFDVSIAGIIGPGKQLIDITSKKKYYESPNKDLSNTAIFSLRFINSSDSVNIDPKTLHELYRNYELRVSDLSASDKSVTTSFALNKFHAHASLVVDQTEEHADFSRYGSMYNETVDFDKSQAAFLEIVSKPEVMNTKESIVRFKPEFPKDVQEKFDKQLKEKDKYPKFEDPNALNEKLLQKNPAALLPIDKNRINEPEYYQKAVFAFQNRVNEVFIDDARQLKQYKFNNFAAQIIGDRIDHLGTPLTLNFFAKKEVNSKNGNEYTTESATKIKQLVDNTGRFDVTPTDELILQRTVTKNNIAISESFTIDYSENSFSVKFVKDSIDAQDNIHHLPGGYEVALRTGKDGGLEINEGKGFKKAKGISAEQAQKELEKVQQEMVDLYWENVASLSNKKTKSLQRGWGEQAKSVVDRIVFDVHESDPPTVAQPPSKKLKQ